MHTKSLVSLLSLLVVCACAEETIETMSEKDSYSEIQLTVNAVMGKDSATKTQLQDDGTIKWTRGDAINLFYGDISSGKFSTSITSPAATATFTGSVTVATGNTQIGGAARSFWGVYPYNADNTCDGSSVTLTISSEQSPVSGSFQDKCNPTVAKSDNLDLTFYNVGSWFGFSVNTTGIVSAVFSGNSNEDIAGTVKVCMEDGRPVVKEVIEGKKSITIIAPEGGFVPQKIYYIALIPTPMPNGYTLKLQRVKEESVLAINSPKPFERNTPRIKLEADSNLPWVEREIPFKDPVVAQICLEHFDSNGDGKLMFSEAEAVSTSLRDYFKGNTEITSFDELQYFTNIMAMSNAFEGCTNLKSVTIPNANWKNSYHYQAAFKGCTSLQKVTILTTVAVSKEAFYGCTSLQSIEIPEGASSIGENAFEGCTNLTTVTLPSTVTLLYSGSFKNCAKLNNIDLKNVVDINSSAFYKCESLTHVDLQKIETIGTMAFEHCVGLTSIEFPNTLESLGMEAFGYTSITQMIIPESLEELPTQSLFANCLKLEYVSLPSQIIKIPKYTFFNCPALNRLELRSNWANLVNDHNFDAKVPDIYVPADRVDLYKSSSGWGNYADHIFALSE